MRLKGWKIARHFNRNLACDSTTHAKLPGEITNDLFVRVKKED